MPAATPIAFTPQRNQIVLQNVNTQGPGDWLPLCTNKRPPDHDNSTQSDINSELIPYEYIDGLVQVRRNSSALAMELRLSCTNPTIFTYNGIILHKMSYLCQNTSAIFLLSI